MAKRFTDTSKWDSAWFSALPPKMKLAWLYLCDKCDHAGIWDINLPLLSFQLGEQITLDEICAAFAGKVEVRGGRLVVISFIEFQYGGLNPKNRVHKSILNRLQTMGLPALQKGLTSPLDGAKEEEEEKEYSSSSKREEHDAPQKENPEKTSSPVLLSDARFRLAKEIEQVKASLAPLFGGPVPKKVIARIPEMLIECDGDPAAVHQILEDIYQSPKIQTGEGLTGSRASYVFAAIRDRFNLGGGA